MSLCYASSQNIEVNGNNFTIDVCLFARQYTFSAKDKYPFNPGYTLEMFYFINRLSAFEMLKHDITILNIIIEFGT
jgi:hypothetical protein